MTRRAPLAVLAALPLALAGCGQASDPTTGPTRSATPSKSAAPVALDRPWLLRLDQYAGADGETRIPTYVRIVPDTGQATAVRLPEVSKPEVRQTGWPLLVDAGFDWALSDNRPAPADRAAGVVRLYGLSDGGKVRTIDVRKASGDAGLHTDWVSFDPARPALLRVVSGSAVWTVDVGAGTASREGSLPKREGWIFSGGFDRRTGEPFIESIDSFETLPAGNGGDKIQLAERDGGRQVDTMQGYGKLPDPGCDFSAAFTMKDGTTVAFCPVGPKVQVKVLAKDAKTWTDRGTSGNVVPTEGDPQYALPPV